MSRTVIQKSENRPEGMDRHSAGRRDNYADASVVLTGRRTVGYSGEFIEALGINRYQYDIGPDLSADELAEMIRITHEPFLCRAPHRFDEPLDLERIANVGVEPPTLGDTDRPVASRVLGGGGTLNVLLVTSRQVGRISRVVRPIFTLEHVDPQGRSLVLPVGAGHVRILAGRKDVCLLKEPIKNADELVDLIERVVVNHADPNDTIL